MRMLLLIAVTGCGGEPESAIPPLAGTTAAGGEPQNTVPPDSLLYGVPASEIVRVVPVETEIPGLPAGWEGMRIAVLSDFQLGLWSDNAEVAAAAVRKAAESDVDAFVLLGDYVAGADEIAALERILAPLPGRPVLAVLGDRDVQADSIETRVTQTLDDLGVTVLRNSRTPLVRGGDTAYIAGLSPDFGSLPEWRQEEISNALGGTPDTPILLSHIPGAASAIPDARFSLVLAGHTFCGEVEIPGTPQLSALRSEFVPGGEEAEAERLFRVNGNNLLVTCGVGYSFVPVRLGAPPEVLLLTLRGAVPEVSPATQSADSL